MDDEKRIALAVAWKLSSLMVQDSVSLLGFDDELESIEAKLRLTVHSLPMIHWRKPLREIVYDIEEVIDILVSKQSQRINLITSCVLDLFDLIGHYKLQKKLDDIKADLFSSDKVYYKRESWWKIPDKDLDLGESVISPVIRKTKAIISENGTLSSALKRKARWLKDELITLNDFLKILQVNELSQAGTAWLEELNDVCRFAEDAIGLFLYETEKAKRTWIGPFKSVFSQRKLSKEMDYIKSKLQDISKRKLSSMQRKPQKFTLSEFRSRPLPLTNAEQPEIIPIFNGDVTDIVEMLLKNDQNCLTISIIGMEGTGKTSLAKLICKHHAIRDQFPTRVWVPSAGMDSLMKQIVGEEYSKMASSRIRYDDLMSNYRVMLNAALKSNKYLIVIDDVREKRLWNGIGAAFDGLSNGTRVIFTAREVGLTPQDCDRNFTYRLQLRSDDESWTLFTHLLQRTIPPELGNLKKEIVRKCGGLPLMVKRVVDIMSKRDFDVRDWSNTLADLNKEEGPWSTTLYEINKNLALYLRRCLFYFGLFPQDYDIPVRRLIVLWVAEGLGRQGEDNESPEKVSEMCLMELVNQNMIQITERKLHGDISRCRLPEVLQLHWLSKAKETNFLQDSNLTRRLADHLDSKDPSFDHIHGNKNSLISSNYKRVVSFLSFDTREGNTPGNDIGNFLERCISKGSFSFLWVLDLENVYKPKLPKVVGQLTRLRYLGLRSTYLEILPIFIDRLLSLQTLDLKRTCIQNVPNTIWKMRRLRHLFLDESFCTLFVPKQEDSGLVDLQTLWGAFVDELSPLRNGIDTLLNVTKLGLKCKVSGPSQKQAMSLQLEAIAKWVMNLKCLRILRLKSFDESNQPWDLHLEDLSGHTDLSSVYLAGILKNQQLVSKFPKNLIELTLSASGLAEDPLQKLGKLPNLRILKLLSKSFTGNKMICSNGGFPKLEILKFWGLEILEEWIVEEGTTPSLRELEIRLCKNLMVIPDELMLIKNLREVRIAKSPKLSGWIKESKGEPEGWNKMSHLHVIIED